MKVLLCSPDHFRVEYVINPWMKPGTVDPALALRQWKKLKQTFETIGVEVEVITQDIRYPDMVFTADQGIVKGNKVLLSNFFHKERKGETQVYKDWFETHGYETRIVSGFCFEGGEILSFDNGYFLGTGFRSSKEVMSELENFLETPIWPLDLIDARFYHLDTCLLVLDSTTAFYYPPAFSIDSKTILKERIPNLIEFTKAQVSDFAANSMVYNHHLITPSVEDTFVKKVADLGFIVHSVPMTEYIKSGGAAHCLTLSIS